VTSRCQLGVLGEKYGAIRSCGWEEDSTQCVCLEVSGGVCCPVSKLGQLHFSAALLRQGPSLFGPSGSRIKLPIRPTKQETSVESLDHELHSLRSGRRGRHASI
jgi:hypothetical protein